MPQPDRILYFGRRDAQPDQPLSTRSMPVRAPESLDEAARSIRVVMSTEQPVMTFDWERYDYVPEVLLADGMQAPEQVPFLDSHARYSVENVLGSARDFKPVSVSGLKGMDAQVTFSSTDEGDSAFRKYQEGHLTDVSVGYGVLSRVFVEKDTTATVDGRTYTGPISVVTKWVLRELSAAPIGADDLAKARAKYQRQGGDNMKITEKLRALLVLRGMNPAATDEQARAFLAGMSDEVRADLIAQSERADTPAPAPSNPAPAAPAPVADPGRSATGPIVPDVATARAEAAREERGRIDAIRSHCRSTGLDDEFADKLVASGEGLDKCRELILSELTTRSKVLGGRMEIGRTDSEKFRAAASDALALRAGCRIEKPAEGHEPLRGRSLLQLAEECLERAGVNTRSMTKMEIAKRVFQSGTTSDFPNILGVSINRVLRDAYMEAPSTFEAWCHVVDASDFKAMDRLQLSEAPDLELVGEGGEYKTGKFLEGKESYKVGKYGRKFGVSWETIVNDDMGALARVPRLFGNASRRKVNDLVYQILTGSHKMSDGKELFHTDHKNLAASGASLVVESLSAARKAMRKQKGLNGSKLNITPRFLLVPSDLETAADVLLRSLSDPAATNSNTVNPFQNRLTPIVESRLDPESGAVPYYLAADSGQIDTLEVAFLEGRQEPWLEERQSFDTDGMEYKVRIVFGAKAIDWRGLYKNPGVSA